MKTKIIPSERIIVIEPIDVKAGGTIEYVSEKRQEAGKVIAVGSPGWFENGNPRPMPIDIRKGNIVAYRRFGDDKIFIEGKEYLFVSFPDVLGIIEK